MTGREREGDREGERGRQGERGGSERYSKSAKIHDRGREGGGVEDEKEGGESEGGGRERETKIEGKLTQLTSRLPKRILLLGKFH